MCGVAGIFNLDNLNLLQAEPLYRMTNNMRHRGPDDEGFVLINTRGVVNTYFGDDTLKSPSNDVVVYCYPKRHVRHAFDKTSCIALGHRRLSIIDRSSYGHQPLSSNDGRYWVIFNGEIYNFLELSKKLKLCGIQFNGHSDTEVLLYAYIVWGEKCLEEFNGDFAFAVWDNKEKYLFCARDRVGVKPFYYTIQNNQFVFASDIKTIIASGLYVPEVSPEGLYLSMAFGIAPRPITAFKDIHALEQGCWMRVHCSGKIEKCCYWNIPIGTQDYSMSKNNAVELLEYELKQSIKLRLHSDVSVGTFMSGGVDSTLISAIASELQPGIKSITLAYEDAAPELDEVRQAMATAKMHKMEHIVHYVNSRIALSDLDLWIDGYEEPFFTIAANFVISKVAKQHGVSVVLNGLGGDELFAGYGYYRYAKLWPLIKKVAPVVGFLLQRTVGNKASRFNAMSNITCADQLYTFLFQKNSDHLLHQLFMHPKLKEVNTVNVLKSLYARDFEFSDPIEAMNYMDIKHCIGNHHVHRVDQFTMMHSIEGRFPFLDHKLIELAFKIPSKWKIYDKKQKYVLREVAKKYIDSSCLGMKKKGFGLPLKQWMDGPLRLMIKTKIEALKTRPLICGDVVAKWYKDYDLGRIPPYRIWHLTALELWFEHFIDRRNIH